MHDQWVYRWIVLSVELLGQVALQARIAANQFLAERLFPRIVG